MRWHDVDSLENRDPEAIERTIHALEPVLEAFFHPTVRGFEHIPDGPGLYVANHNGGILLPDAYVLGVSLYRHRGLSDLPFVLAHDLAVRAPLANQLMPKLGAVRANPANAHRLFAAGHKVLVYPGGDRETFRPFRERDRIVFGDRRGYLRLALTEGVPITPVVTAGAHAGLMVLDDGGRIARFLRLDRALRVKVCPVVLSAPWGVTVGFPPPYVPMPTRIYMEFLPAIRFDRSGPDAAADEAYVEACHQQVATAMQSALSRLSAERARDKRARHLSALDATAARWRLQPAWRDALEELAILSGVTPKLGVD